MISVIRFISAGLVVIFFNGCAGAGFFKAICKGIVGQARDDIAVGGHAANEIKHSERS
jgi:hypothetical protein